MKYIARTALLFFLIISTVFASKLEIKINGKNIELPHWSAKKGQYGAVVLIHGGQQPRWSPLLAHLAKQLANEGWTTVLLNCNQFNSETWIKELPEVITTLRQQKNNRIVVLHYGEQLQQTLNAFNKSPQPGIEGLVLLSAYDIPKPEIKKSELQLDLFDVVGQFDYEPVLDQLSFRQQEFGQKHYLSMQIPGAHHDYEYSHQLLLSFLHGWMHKLAEFKPIPPPVLVSYIEPVALLLQKDLAFDDQSNWTGFLENPPEPTQEIEERSELSP